MIICKLELNDVDTLYQLKNDQETNNQLGGFTSGYSKKISKTGYLHIYKHLMKVFI